MDVINFISKADGLPDADISAPGAKHQHGAATHYACGPRLHEYLREIGKILKQYDAFSVSEMHSVNDPKQVIKSVGESRGELDMIFSLEMLERMAGSDEAVLAIARKQYKLKSRHNARTPDQWDSNRNAGFSNGTPWIKVNDDFTYCNAASRVANPGSVLKLWRSCLALRNDLRDVITYGDFELIDAEHDHIFAYSRTNCNWKAQAVTVCSSRETRVS
ncbi:uncharacterized protein E0L32_012142 [Thyridium curvatum]|uniref:Glycosyl hydrolase family 13 catalytic domain-containing protein n=1 Tax=Thyridium curvatum TaxID=1093900 RepID=A0A507BJD3_9PEZI|nr:uncharacterized protein E0L32_012142 [Thyridium curvatum]TPX17549.1 hypothetical protein E0L32_012142 [Thyridium curvatum]